MKGTQGEQLHPQDIVIPIELFDDPELTLREAVFIVVVNMLDRKDRHCFASNEYLAKRARVSEHHVANMLTKLRKQGWIIDVSQEGERRLTTLLRIRREVMRPQTEVIQEEARPINRNDNSDRSEEARPINSNIINPSEDDLRKREEERNPLSIFKKRFPEFTPSCFQQDEILTTVLDLELWQRAVDDWARNSNQARSVGKLLDMYSRWVVNGGPDGQSTGNYRQQREQQAINEHNIIEGFRAKAEARRLQRSDGGDSA